MPGEHHHPIHPWGIPQLGPTEEELVRAKGDLFWDVEGGEEVHCSFVGVETVIGLFGAEGAMEGCDEGWRGEGGGLRGGLFDFQVRLAAQKPISMALRK